MIDPHDPNQHSVDLDDQQSTQDLSNESLTTTEQSQEYIEEPITLDIRFRDAVYFAGQGSFGLAESLLNELCEELPVHAHKSRAAICGIHIDIADERGDTEAALAHTLKRIEHLKRDPETNVLESIRETKQLADRYFELRRFNQALWKYWAAFRSLEEFASVRLPSGDRRFDSEQSAYLGNQILSSLCQIYREDRRTEDLDQVRRISQEWGLGQPNHFRPRPQRVTIDLDDDDMNDIIRKLGGDIDGED